MRRRLIARAQRTSARRLLLCFAMGRGKSDRKRPQDWLRSLGLSAEFPRDGLAVLVDALRPGALAMDRADFLRVPPCHPRYREGTRCYVGSYRLSRCAYKCA